MQNTQSKDQQKNNFLKEQILPIFLTAVTALLLSGLLWLEGNILNKFTQDDIVLKIQLSDVLLGLTIYLKTSIDFAIFIARLMDGNSGWRSRIAIELGSSIGNFAGTAAILLLWVFFKEVEILLAVMVFVASLVLLRMAEDGLEHAQMEDKKNPKFLQKFVSGFEFVLGKINGAAAPALKYIIPHTKISHKTNLHFWPLFAFSFTIPFILGLDDFAGYVPLFNVIKVYGFAVGVILGHMILNILLYISPKRTVQIVKNPIISLLGSLAFAGLALWGLTEVVKILGH